MSESFNLCDRGWKQVAVFVAHPDDETFCSGLIRALADQGSEITVYCLTKGEGGPTGGRDRSELGSIRAQEMEQSCEKLGVNRVEFLGYIDPLAGESGVAPDVSAEVLAKQIVALLDGQDLIISHGSDGEYRHPAHLLVFEAVEKAVAGRALSRLTFMAQDGGHPIPKIVNASDEASWILDVSRYAEVRQAALESHASQLALFAKFAGSENFADFIRLTSQESYREWPNSA